MMKKILLALVLQSLSNAHAVPKEECFPFETLPATMELQAREFLLQALDQEALFTLAGNLKPWSTFGPTYVETENSVNDLKTTRALLSRFTCGKNLSAHLHQYAPHTNGESFFQAYILHEPTAALRIQKHSDFFRRIEVYPFNDQLPALLQKIEYAPRYHRFEGYGHLFGYPASAVQFFVQAEKFHDETGQFVPREFISIPTHQADSGSFVWAVPVGHQRNEEEKRIQENAAAILARYRLLRAKWIKAVDHESEGPRSLELIREWYHNGHGDYAPEYANTSDSASAAPGSPK